MGRAWHSHREKVRDLSPFFGSCSPPIFQSTVRIVLYIYIYIYLSIYLYRGRTVVHSLRQRRGRQPKRYRPMRSTTNRPRRAAASKNRVMFALSPAVHCRGCAPPVPVPQHSVALGAGWCTDQNTYLIAKSQTMKVSQFADAFALLSHTFGQHRGSRDSEHMHTLAPQRIREPAPRDHMQLEPCIGESPTLFVVYE